ncbi:hypothetical protein E2C01_034629 [Portunus trituberculatus]|uniref:Uncharacterized protein n=1 Tax=Portunus trituberculatus TaxID=210409 RepID=A0A5B7F7F4_PORTR|nr:hypothetical protein [Portunus trituberculatus]
MIQYHLENDLGLPCRCAAKKPLRTVAMWKKTCTMQFHVLELSLRVIISFIPTKKRYIMMCCFVEGVGQYDPRSSNINVSTKTNKTVLRYKHQRFCVQNTISQHLTFSSSCIPFSMGILLPDVTPRWSCFPLFLALSCLHGSKFAAETLHCQPYRRPSEAMSLGRHPSCPVWQQEVECPRNERELLN